MLVTVTLVDIALARTERGLLPYNGHCPVAQAMKRAGYANPLVGSSQVRLDQTSYWFGSSVTRWIGDYDNDRPVDSFSFTLEAL